MESRQFISTYDRIRLYEEFERAWAGLAIRYRLELRQAEREVDRDRRRIEVSARLQRLCTPAALAYGRLLENRLTTKVMDEAFKMGLRLIARLADQCGIFSMSDKSLDPLAPVVKWLPVLAYHRFLRFLDLRESNYRDRVSKAATLKDLSDMFRRQSARLEHELLRVKAQYAREVWT